MFKPAMQVQMWRGDLNFVQWLAAGEPWTMIEVKKSHLYLSSQALIFCTRPEEFCTEGLGRVQPPDNFFGISNLCTLPLVVLICYKICTGPKTVLYKNFTVRKWSCTKFVPVYYRFTTSCKLCTRPFTTYQKCNVQNRRTRPEGYKGCSARKTSVLPLNFLSITNSSAGSR